MKTRDIFMENLKRLRKAKGLSQDDFAPMVGFGLRGYQKYEQGESSPTPDILDRFAEKLECEPWELTKPEIGRPKSPDLVAAADLLSKFSDLPPARRGFVLALLYRDESYLSGLNRILHQAYQALLKVP